MRWKGFFVAAAVIAVPWLAVSLTGGERRRAVVRWDDDAEVPSTLVGILAHEMRSPLATLRGAVDLLRRDTLPAERRAEILEITDEAATHLARIVDDAVAAVRALPRRHPDRGNAREPRAGRARLRPRGVY